MIFRAVATRHALHPDLATRLDGILLAHYRLDRRRFLLDFPGEYPPPDIVDLRPDWVRDYVELADEESANGGLPSGSPDTLMAFLETLNS